MEKRWKRKVKAEEKLCTTYRFSTSTKHLYKIKPVYLFCGRNLKYSYLFWKGGWQKITKDQLSEEEEGTQVRAKFSQVSRDAGRVPKITRKLQPRNECRG